MRCPYCGRAYARAASCVYLKGDPIPAPFVAPSGFRCAECNVIPENPHHAYCSKAECPRCGGPFADCGAIECEVAA
jgi:hypothetical protein